MNSAEALVLGEEGWMCLLVCDSPLTTFHSSFFILNFIYSPKLYDLNSNLPSILDFIPKLEIYPKKIVMNNKRNKKRDRAWVSSQVALR